MNNQHLDRKRFCFCLNFIKAVYCQLGCTFYVYDGFITTKTCETKCGAKNAFFQACFYGCTGLNRPQLPTKYFSTVSSYTSLETSTYDPKTNSRVLNYVAPALMGIMVISIIFFCFRSMMPNYSLFKNVYFIYLSEV
jgi:hypothetical protein